MTSNSERSCGKCTESVANGLGVIMCPHLPRDQIIHDTLGMTGRILASICQHYTLPEPPEPPEPSAFEKWFTNYRCGPIDTYIDFARAGYKQRGEDDVDAVHEHYRKYGMSKQCFPGPSVAPPMPWTDVDAVEAIRKNDKEQGCE